MFHNDEAVHPGPYALSKKVRIGLPELRQTTEPSWQG